MGTVRPWQRIELTFEASRTYHWSSFPLQVEFRCGAEVIRLDAFWDGDQCWKVGFAPTCAGTWTWSSHADDPSLGGRRGKIECTAAMPDEVEENPNLHGFVSVSSNGRYFEYADGTPFLWLGDTLWAVSTKRCGLGDHRDGAFYRWLRNRKARGFTTACIQFFRRLSQSNEGGYPFPANTDDNGTFEQLNPEFFRYLDVRMDSLWQAGFVVAAHPTWFGKPQGGMTSISPVHAQQITRYLLARYGAYNLIYSLSGEYQHSYVDMVRPWTSDDWRALGNHVRSWNAYRHPVSVMPVGTGEPGTANVLPPEASTGSSAGEFHGEEWLDHNWIQTGHRASLLWRIPQRIAENRALLPPKPVVQSEGWYEDFEDPNLLVRCNDAHIRWQAWVSILSGAAGHTYGHGDVWGCFSKLDDPVSVRDAEEGDRMLTRGLEAEGARCLGHLRRLFDGIAWWRMEPRQELIDTKGLLMRQANEWYLRTPFCAAVPGELYVVYYPATTGRRMKTLRLEPGTDYVARWFSPISGETHGLSVDHIEANGVWHVPACADSLDWVLVVERAGG